MKYDLNMTFRKSRRLWECAGLLENRPFDADRLWVPPVVELEGNRLYWSRAKEVNGRITGGTLKAESPAMMEEFLRLADASPEKIRDFARHWGVLEICKHSLPRSHNPPGYPLPDPVTWCNPRGFRDSRSNCWEPLDAWRHFSRQFAAVLNIRARLEEGKVGKSEDWKMALNNPDAPYWKQNITAEHDRLAMRLNEFLRIGAVRPSVHWFDYERWQAGLPMRGWSIKLTFGGLFGALASQLAFAVARTQGLAICSACARPFTPIKQLSNGRRHYCTDCKKASARDASRDYRRRKRDATPANGKQVNTARK
jgi:hypothetical protein